MATFTTDYKAIGGVCIHDVPPEDFDKLQTQFNAKKDSYKKITEWANFNIGNTQITLFKDMKEEVPTCTGLKERKLIRW